jgi:hypothetical protein
MNHNNLLPCITALFLGCGAAGSGSPTCCAALNHPPGATLHYTIRYRQEVSPATLSVQLDAAGLHAANGRLVVRLANWGEWTSAPYTYLRNLRIDGRAVTHDANGVIAVPGELLADGRLDMRYDLVVQPHGTPEHRRRRLLPHSTDTYAFAFVSNTLVRFTVDGGPIDADVTVRVEAAPDQHIFTGWNGFSVGTQAAAAPATLTSDNGIFAIGRGPRLPSTALRSRSSRLHRGRMRRRPSRKPRAP